MFESILHGLRQIAGWIIPLAQAAEVTLALSVISVVIGIIGGVFIALGRISRGKILKRICGAYIFVFRGTPLLMQLFFLWTALPLAIPALTMQNRFLAAVIAFSLNSAAYQAEIIRAAIQSIDPGQMEAAKSLGLTYSQAMRLIIFPQSIKRLVPPIGNEFIMVLKDTSLVQMISLVDLMKKTNQIQSSAATALVYLPSAVMYLIFTGVFTWLFNRLEKHHARYE
ncbi:MAG: amino acid ABC transporter permease [Oscillospiraceae bacterium]|nr:amino acid ABC transporter permease [Oscillospiraceae bacterium]